MSFNSKLHIVFQTFCLVSTLHFVALSVGGIYYLRLFSSAKEKIISVQNKTETEKKTDSDSSDDVPESENINDYKVVCFIDNYSIFDKSLALSESVYHSALTLFSTYSSRVLRGYYAVIIKPPRV